MYLIIRKLQYGIRVLINELTDKEDYWHLRLKPIIGVLSNKKIYFHDMIQKSKYPGDFVNNIPVIYIDGKYQVFFFITIFNYALGLLNRYNLNEDVSNEIKLILNWTLLNQQDDGSWRYNMPPETHSLSENKPSGMTQGLAISFIIRAYRCGFLTKEKCLLSTSKSIEFMLSDKIVSIYNGNKLIEEFFNPGDGILNGSIFAIYGIYDYCTEINNYDIFNEYLNDLKSLMSVYRFLNWSYYDMNKTINSKFYHQLHIDMMYVLYDLSKDYFFIEYAKYWERGLRFSFLFILLKSAQKLLNIKNIPITYSNKI